MIKIPLASPVFHCAIFCLQHESYKMMRNVRYVFICTKTMRMTSLLDEELKNTGAMQVLLTQIQTESVCQTHAIYTKHIITYISVIIKSFRNRTLEVIKIYLFSPWSFQRVICYGYFVFIFHFISSLLFSALP